MCMYTYILIYTYIYILYILSYTYVYIFCVLSVFMRGDFDVFAIFRLKPYLTIRLRVRDFYEVIVDEGKARIDWCYLVEIERE